MLCVVLRKPVGLEDCQLTRIPVAKGESGLLNRETRLYAIDIGNSFTKVGYFQSEARLALDVFPTDKADFCVTLTEMENYLLKTEHRQADGLVISSVVPMARTWEGEFQRIFGNVPILWLDRGTMHTLNLGPVDLSRYAPRELGTDRVADIVGGHMAFPGRNTLICDLGTTSTFDLVDRAGVYLGGAICPGPRKFQALVDTTQAAQLYQVDVFHAPSGTPGLSTQACLENGLYYGYRGVILEMIDMLLKSVSWRVAETCFIFTGGCALHAAAMVADRIPQVQVNTELTVNGLQHIWALNAPVHSAVGNHPV